MDDAPDSAGALLNQISRIRLQAAALGAAEGDDLAAFLAADVDALPEGFFWCTRHPFRIETPGPLHRVAQESQEHRGGTTEAGGGGIHESKRAGLDMVEKDGKFPIINRTGILCQQIPDPPSKMNHSGPMITASMR